MSEAEQLPKVQVKRSSAGLGLFACEDIIKGEYIIEYTGERINEAEANDRGGKYLFEVTEDLIIDGKGRENKARYINHSCRPNAEAEHDEDTDQIFIRAKKKIRTGEEITYHYGKIYFDDIIRPIGCRCKKCYSQSKQ